MAIEVTLVPELTPEVAAATNHAANKDKFVQVMAGGVFLADVRSSQFTKNYVLKTDPRSGEPCSVSGGPNIAKVIAGEAITRGGPVQVMSASGLAGACPANSFTYVVGHAWSTAAGSGEYLGVKLI